MRLLNVDFIIQFSNYHLKYDLNANIFWIERVLNGCEFIFG